jgi:hypothetical protein
LQAGGASHIVLDLSFRAGVVRLVIVAGEVVTLATEGGKGMEALGGHGNSGCSRLALVPLQCSIISIKLFSVHMVYTIVHHLTPVVTTRTCGYR